VRGVDKSHAAHNSQVVNFHEYLSHMSQLNQAFSMSQQLRDDCNGENHKYIAHQVGILSQSSARVFHSGLKWGARGHHVALLADCCNLAHKTLIDTQQCSA
jgi:hypothetical protein